MGIPTFEGSSGRVFPEKGLTPADILSKLKKKLTDQGVEFHLKHTFTGFGEDQSVIFKKWKKQSCGSG
jgi:predicted flavoprotein YhiN